MKSYLLSLAFFLCSYLLTAQIIDTTFSDTNIFMFESDVRDLLKKPMHHYTSLGDLNTRVATKNNEKLADSPASVMLFTQKDIQNFGYYTLGDIASITSGYSIGENFGEKIYETRGQIASGYENDKHLVLIDGIPVNFARNYKAPVDEELPIYFADKIELLKGPASALYGIGAFNGVINLVSKAPDNHSPLAEAKCTLGSVDHTIRLMANLAHKSEKGLAKLNIGYFSKLPSANFVGQTPNPNYRYWDSKRALFFNTAYEIYQGIFKGLNVGVIYLRRDGGQGEFYLGNFSTEMNAIIWETFVPYLKYHRDLNEKLSFNSYLKCNQSLEQAYIAVPSNVSTPFATYKIVTGNMEFFSEIKYKINETSSLIVGINLDNKATLGYPNSYENFFVRIDTLQNPPQVTYSFDTLASRQSDPLFTHSYFVQYQKEFNVLKGLILTTGLRFDSGITPRNQYSQLSPRLALVQRFTDWFNVRMMYAQALLAPSIKQLSINKNVLTDERYINEPYIQTLGDLKAQAMRSVEAGVVFNHKWLTANITAFVNQTNNIIRRDFDFGVFINDEGFTNAQGIELDIQMSYKNLRFLANYATAKALYHPKINGNMDVAQTQANVPTAKANLGVYYTLPKKWKATFALIHKFIQGFHSGGAESANKIETGFHMTDINILLPITKEMGLELQVRNLLDVDAKYPFGGKAHIPLAQKQFLGTLSIKF